MARFINRSWRSLRDGFRSLANTAVRVLKRFALRAMPVAIEQPAIALSYLCRKTEMIKGDVAHASNLLRTGIVRPAILFILFAALSVANATIINNTATMTYTLGSGSASVNVDASIRTTSSIELYQYAPGVSGASNLPVMPTEYSTSGNTSGSFTTSDPATEFDGTPIPTPGNYDLLPISAIKSGEPIFVRIVDADQNTDSAVAETVLVQIATSLSGDTVTVRLTETGPNTGEFIGYVQTTPGSVVVNDGYLSVQTNDSITATYVDSSDSSDSANGTVLVDPYGVLFSTSDGSPLDGATVTLVDVSTGQPATVYGDDGISMYPATVTSGGSTADSSGNVYNFPPGNYRFPYVTPGTYQLYVIPPSGFVIPSTVPDATIQTLPGAPYSIVTGSRGENFVVNPGPALHIDVPLDPDNSGLFVTKQATKANAAIGEFVQYKLTLSNISSGGLTGTTITDLLPLGFRLEKGSTRINGSVAPDPAISNDGRTLTFNVGAMPASSVTNISYVAAIGIGVKLGDAVNTATASADGGIESNTAQATVRVEDDMMATRSFIMGRVMMGSCSADPPDEGFVSIQLLSKAVMDEVHYSIPIHVDTVAVQDFSIYVDLPGVLEFVPGSATIDGKPVADPERSNSHLQFNLGDLAANQALKLSFVTRSRSEVYGDFSTQANAQFYVSSSQAKNKSLLKITPMVGNRFKDYPRSYRTRFDTLSADLTATDKDNLADLAHILRDQKVSRITVVGHADKRKIRATSRSKFKNNEELSLARATAVATHVKTLFDLTDEQIITSGLGISRPVYYSEKLQGGLLSKDEQLSLNRRVEIYIELEDQLADTRFIVTQGDSGVKHTATLGPQGELSAPELGLGAPGVKGIRLYLEDGRFVDTDEQGLYHFEGVRPGTHIVQVDEDSLPEHLEIYQCEDNTRFAGTPHSRFVDIQPGGMWRADFHIRQKPEVSSHGKVSVQLSSTLSENRLKYHVALQGTSIRFNDRSLIVKLPAGLSYVDNSARFDGELLNRPGRQDDKLVFNLGDEKQVSWDSTLTFEADIKLRLEGEYQTSAMLRFKSSDGTTRYSSEATNSVLYQAKVKERYIFEASYADKESDISTRDRADLDSVIDFLLDKKIRKIRIVGHTDDRAIPEHLHRVYANNKALSLDRATKVGAYMARKLGLYSKQIEVVGMGFEQPRDRNTTDNARQSNRRTEVYVSYGDNSGERETIISDHDSGVLSSVVSSGQQTKTTPNVDTTTEPDKPQEVDGILSIKDGQLVSDRIQSVRIRMDSRLIPILKVDGVEIPKKRIGMKAPEQGTGRTIYSYVGVDLGARAGKHTITLRGMGPFGNARFKQDISYTRTGDILSARVISSDGNIADGKTPVQIRVQLFDQTGASIKSDAEFNFVDGSLRPYEDREQLPELRKSRKTVLIDSDGYIKFDPVTQSGLYNAILSYNQFTFEVRTYVTPKYREWIMVGLAEGTAGYNSTTGNMENLDAHDIQDEYTSDGRLAFYAKGKIKGKYLLTMAYDSEKEQPEVSGNGLFGSIDPNKYYTLYGDKTQVYYDAASSEKLFVKLESDEFYALFGDYETGLTVTELSHYSRSLTGLKTEYKSNRIDLVAFAAETENGFVKDELRGDGTSGLYYLSNKNIVINSEKIRIEIRDRFKSEAVIDSKQMTRYVDYTFDPVDGTVYFREPIYSRDENFNPVYIVIDYEAEGNVGNNITAGGRFAVRSSAKGPEVGATIIKDDTLGAEGELYGADAKYSLTNNTNIRVEIATTSRNNNGNELDGNAGLMEITHRNARLESSVYFRQQDPDFGLGQQKGSESGTRKYGADVRSKIRDNISLDAEFIHQDNLNTGAKRNVLSTGVEVQSNIYTVTGGVLFARDQYTDGSLFETNKLTGSAKRKFLDGLLEAYASADVGIENDNADYANRLVLGADYFITDKTQLFAQQEFAFSDVQDSQMTRVGAKTSPWRNATAYSSVENQSSEYGPRIFANMGLTQGIDLNKNWRLDFGLERTHTVRDQTVPPLNVNVPPASGTYNNNDFTAASVGASYKDALWSMTSRADIRVGDLEDKLALLFGVYHEPVPGFGLATALKYFDTDRSNATRNTQSSLEFSLARRPITSQWIILDKIRFVHEKEVTSDDSITTVKLINNLNTNYLYDRQNQLALNYGIKYVQDDFDSGSYSGITQIFGTEYRHDFNRKWDAGVQASLLFSDVGDSQRYSYGASVGHSFAKNVWLSVGFNFAGFTDKDFSAAKYTAEGVYVKFRFAFDHHTTRKAMAWWEK